MPPKAKWTSETERRRESYARARAELIGLMGGKCSNEDCGSVFEFEFHHKFGKDWEPSKTSRWVRLARYRREWKAGLVELLCKTCNAKAGRPEPPDDDLPVIQIGDEDCPF